MTELIRCMMELQPEFPVSMWPSILPFLSVDECMEIRRLNKTIEHIVVKHFVTLYWFKSIPLPKFLFKCTNLTSLIIHHYPMGNNTILDSHNVQYLPKSLLTLVIPKGCNLDENEDIALLPRHLTHLDIGSAAFYKDGSLAQLPSTLTFLKCHIATLSRISKMTLEHLPPLLKTFILHDDEQSIYGDISVLPGNFMAQLPRTLTHLSFCAEKTLTIDQLQQLPPQLQVLCIYRDACLPSVDCLPRTITDLKLPNQNNFTDDQLSQLPPLLKYLNLNRNREITHVGIQHLPSTLISLDLPKLSLVDKQIHCLPRNLTHLNLNDNHQLTSACFVHLPRTLISLHLQRIETIDEDDLQYLPPNLQQLSLPLHIIPGETCISQLPKSLTQLHLLYQHLHVSTLEQLPLQLVHLKMDTIDLTEAHLKALPRTLKTIVLYQDTLLSDTAFTYLPQGLTRLELPSYCHLTDQAIVHLPRGLRHLKVARTHCVTLACLKYLPRTLLTTSLAINIHDIASLVHMVDMPPCLDYTLTTTHLKFAWFHQ